MLYPFKFTPILKEKVWGGRKLKTKLNKKADKEHIGESWELSCLPGAVSVVSEGSMEGLSLSQLTERYKDSFTGKKIYKRFGNNFPLLIKFIDATDDLSVQVHPDDFTAKEKHKAKGKSELWYIIDADKGAELVLGVNKKQTKEGFRKLLDSNKVEQALNTVKVKPGDVFFIPAGRIHAIKKGILLAEIQQSSDITYRLYDWNRKGLDGKYRNLHIDDALDAADLNPKKSYFSEYKKVKNEFIVCESNSLFTVNILIFNKEIERNYFDIDSFRIVICIKGSFKIYYPDESVEVKKGETVLIPAVLNEIRFVPETESELLEVYIAS